MNLRRAARAGAGIAGGAGALYLAQRAATSRWHVGADELAAAGLTLPADLRHHFVATSDGGRLHVVERGEGPSFVLVHGIMLGIGIWAPQLRLLGGRVIAVSQRGHGQSRAGTGGYAFDRLASDLAEVLDALEVRDAVLVGHSMGGMIVQQCALSHAQACSGRVRRLVLVGTAPGPRPVRPLLTLAGPLAAAALAGAERRGRGPLPSSAAAWGARLAFGVSPAPASVALVRGMLDAMSPAALAGLLPPLLAFDVRDELGGLTLPVHVVVGGSDVLTPPRTARAIVAGVPDARLTVLPGCGHMVMLERQEALCDLVAG
ncbi:MAG: alpha/beta fold hydrolase [Actinomycetota bacterium]|nr:alpha/beta fold hydrolase [Actinomycetota bacterium]